MHNQIQVPDTIAVSKESVWCDLNGEVVVLHISSGVYFGLDGVGCEIWEFLQKPSTVSQLVDHLTSTYDVPRDICERQVLSFLDKMADAELVIVNANQVAA